MGAGATATLQMFLFGAAGMACCVAAIHAHARDWNAAVGATGAMMLFWALNNALWLFGSLQQWALVTDLAFLGFAAGLWIAVRRRWMLPLIGLSLVAVAIDLSDRIAPLGYAWWSTVSNLNFCAQLVAASYPGWAAIFRLSIVRDEAEPAV